MHAQHTLPDRLRLMGAAFAIMGVICVLGAGVVFGAKQTRRWQTMLRDVADRYGLFMDPGSLLRRAKVHGTVDGAPVVIDTYTTKSGDSTKTWTRLKATPPGMPDGLGLKAESKNFLGRMFRGVEHIIGDPDFDDAVFVEGPEPVVRALLDRETRRRVVQAIRNDVKVHEGCIEWTCGGLAKAEKLLPAIEQVLDLSRRLSRQGDAQAMAAIVRDDMPTVIAEVLRVMPAGPEQAAACAHVLAERSDLPVLMAARLRPGDAGASVARVARLSTNPHHVRVKALKWLADKGDPTAAACARDCLGPPAVAAAALGILARVEPPVPLAMLAPLIKAQPSAVAALRHARRHGTAAEALLIEALESDDPEHAVVAADGLGLVGTVAAVPALREKSTGLFQNSQLKSSALAAIEAIQGRVGTERGALTVVESSEGQLSQVDEPDPTG